MMPHKEVSEAIHQQADPAYGRYEGNQTSTARQHDGDGDNQKEAEAGGQPI